MAGTDISPDLEALLALREPTRATLYAYVVSQPAGVGRDEAAAAVRISRSLAAFHLDRLEAAGLLTASYRRLSGRTGPGAGRPSKLYSRSPRQLDVTLPHREHELLAALLAASASEPHEAPETDSAREVGRSLGARARRRMRATPTLYRLAECAESVLARLGFEPYRESAREIRLRNCPFDPVSRRYESIVCRQALALVGGVLEGVDVDGLGAYRQPNSDRCCVVLRSETGLAR